MKRKSTASNSSTKRDRDSSLETFYKKITAVIEVKNDELEKSLDKKLQVYLKIAQLDAKMIANETIEKLQKTVSAQSSELLIKFDPLLQELQEKRAEMSITTHKLYEMQKELEAQSKRIKKLENQKHN